MLVTKEIITREQEQELLANVPMWKQRATEYNGRYICTLDDVTFDFIPDGYKCVVNMYPPFTGIGAHIDDAALGPDIYVLSIGSDAMLKLFDGSQCTDYIIPARSLYVLKSEERFQYAHQIMGDNPYERVSMTFRETNKCLFLQSI